MSNKINVTEFLEALSGVAESKGLSNEAILNALEEAITRAYIRFLGGKADEPLDQIVTCKINPETGEIQLYSTKEVVATSDDVEDDYRQISVEDANEGRKRAKYKAGDAYIIPAPVDELSKVTAIAIKNNFRTRLAEAEKQSLYQTYKDHIGEMLSGIVEKADDRAVTIRIDKKTIDLTRRELIGDEVFRVGDPIKVYIEEVKAPEPVDGKPSRGPQIQPTRSSEGFLKRLFEEEIHEIYDGTVVIKAIARIAGQRSKVAVASANEDIDATGACIGQGGSRIQKIVAQLGNSSKNKEKIDVIHYFENPGVFIIEAVRPAVALGVNVNEEEKSALVLIEDGTSALAIGRYRSNLLLASRITGYNIDFIERTNAELKGISFTSAEEWALKAEEERRAKERAVLIKRQQEELARREEEARKLAEEEEARRKAEEAAKAALEAQKEAEEAKAKTPSKKVDPIIMPAVMPKANVNPEEFPTEAINPAAAALASMRAAEEARKAAEEAAKEAAPVDAEVPAEESVEVKTTTTLSDLEKELENSKAKPKTQSRSSKRPRKISEEEVAHEPIKPVVPSMPVYTEEELNQMALEEEDVDYEQTDEEIEEEYAEYDDYYDDDK